MAFGGVDMGVVTRSQDYTIIKQNEDNKPVIDQGNVIQQVDKQVEQLTKEVHASDNSEWYNKKHDASEKGDNEYEGDGGKNKNRNRRDSKHVVEQVVIKGRESFDIKI